MNTIFKRIGYITCVLIVIWILGSTTEVWYHNANANHAYSDYNAWILFFGGGEQVTEVTDCVRVGDGYMVTVCDENGTLWSYYDSEQKSKGKIVKIKFNHNRIVDAR